MTKMFTSPLRWQKSLSIALILIASASGCGDSPPTLDPPPAELSQDQKPPPDQGPRQDESVDEPTDWETIHASLADFNRGAALMDRYEYSKAAAAFKKVSETFPSWTAARFNLGLALLNQLGVSEGKSNVDEARIAFESILKDEPEHPYANFCLGMYYQHHGEMEAAAKCFEVVHRVDKQSAFAAYKYAECLRATDKTEEAIPILEGVIEENPGFISGFYLLAQLYMRSSMRDEAKPLFDRFQALHDAELTGGSHIVQAKYGAAGKFYKVLGADNLPLPAREAADAQRIVFSPDTRPLKTQIQTWDWDGGSIGLAGVAVADVDGDQDLDLCLTATDASGSASIWLNDGNGNFAAGDPLAERVISPCFGDVDNDGDVDLWLGRAGTDLVLLNDAAGMFAPALYETVGGPDGLTHMARLVDVDSDGDLDFLAARMAAGDIPVTPSASATASSIFNTNGDGTFEDVAAGLGLAMADTVIAALVFDDLDNDYDLDLIAFPAEGPPITWVNNRLGDYRLLDVESSGLDVEGVISASTGDPDKDGDRDLLVFTKSGLLLLENKGQLRFEEDAAFSARCGRLGGTGGQFADMDNDGDLDIVIGDAHRTGGSRGPAVLVNGWPSDGFVDSAEADPGNMLIAVDTQGDASCVVADFTGNGRNDLFLAPSGQAPMVIENVTEGGQWIQLDLVGTRPKDNRARSNTSAIGARVEVKTGSVFQQYALGGASGAVAMQPLRVHAGLGDHSTVDWLRIIWPDTVLQGELELAADCLATVEEVPRKISSCPYLFAWNGDRFEFVADFGGVGGLGYLVAPGQYAQPDPSEYLIVPGLKPLGDEYVLQTLTMLEEITYFDEAKLIAVDHPPDTSICPNEMMAISVPPPDFELYCYRDPIEPTRVIDQRGADVTERLAAIDRRYAGATTLDPRFTGLAEDHFIELDFADRLNELDADARLILVLHGWVEYGYSSTGYAASQAGRRARAPSIEVYRGGAWVEIAHEIGYPAGINHLMTVDLGGQIEPQDRRIRISSNMELYWDRVFLAEHLPGEELVVTEAPAAGADLHFRGYPREYSPDGQHPNLCDYGNIDRSVGWKLMAGDYTRFGDVTPLLEATDDRFVIMGHGEEITMRFPVDAFPAVRPGWQRTFVLKTDSYCKDMDLYTAHPRTVEPLPFHAMSGYPYGLTESYPDTEETRQYREQYNTRRVGTK